MNPSERKEVHIFNAALELSSPAERAAYLDRACAGDEPLRRKVEALLQACGEAEDFFKTVVDPQAVPARPATAILSITEKAGDKIGRYKLLQQIGEGGCGVVYMAEQQEPVRRRVALKVIKLGMDTKQVVARFEAERQALALMDHPNIAKVLDAGATEAGRPFFVMELVKGIPVTRYANENKLDIQQRLDLFIKICQAVQHAHQKGIIHRDLKPSNVLVADHDGVPVPKVIDFGIAKATTDQRLTDKTLFTALEQFIGTPAYMSPEQAKLSGLDIDTRTDIYSLGVLLYELLTGQTPFNARELLDAGLDELRRTIREVEPPRPSTRLTQELERLGSAPASGAVAGASPATPGAARQSDAALPSTPSADPRGRVSAIPGADVLPTEEEVRASSRRLLRIKESIPLVRGDLDWIVMKCLEKDRTRRYDTANGLAADVQRHLSNEPVIARPPSTLYRFQKMARRNKLAFAATTAVLTALVLGISVSAWQAVRASRESAAARRAETAARRAETLAQTEARRADDEARRAAAASTAARQSLAAADFYQATRLVDADNASEALPFLARSLTLNPTNPAARTRLFTLLNYRTWPLPKLVLTNAGHTDYATFSPDGGRILTVATNDEARVWDAETEKPTTSVMNSDTSYTPYSDELPYEFSTDGKQILTMSTAREVQIWDALSGRLVTAPFGRIVDSAHFNSDGTRVLGVDQFRVQVWDSQSGKHMVGPFGDEAIRSAQYSSDGEKIMTISMTAHGRVWDAKTGQPLTARFERPDVAQIYWSPDGSRIVAFYGTPPRRDESNRTWVEANDIVNTTAQIWDAKNLQPLGRKIPVDVNFWRLEFSPDGSRMTTASDKFRAVHVRDMSTGELAIAPLRHQYGLDTAIFSRDGKRIMTVGDGKLQMWDASSGQPITESFLASRWKFWPVSSPDGGHVLHTAREGRVWMLDVRPGTALPRMFGEPRSIASASISPSGRLLVTVTTNAIITLWDAVSGSGSVLTTERSGSATAEFSTDGEKLIVVSATNTTQVWNVRTRQALAPPRNLGTEVASFHKSGESSMRSDDALAFSPSGERIAIVKPGGNVSVLNALSGEEIWRSVGEARYHRVWFSPGSQWITADGFGTQNRVFDARTGQERANPRGNRQAWRPMFNPEGDRFLENGGNTLRVFDMHKGEQLLREIEADNGCFSLSGQQIISHTLPYLAESSEPCKLQLWDANSGVQITDPFQEIQHESYEASVAPGKLTLDGRWLVTVSTNGQACLWNLSPPPGALPGWLPDLLEALSGKVLNAHGVLEPTPRDPAQLLATLRTQSAAAPPTDEWSTWLRWFLADRATRGAYPLTPGRNTAP